MVQPETVDRRTDEHGKTGFPMFFYANVIMMAKIRTQLSE